MSTLRIAVFAALILLLEALFAEIALAETPIRWLNAWQPSCYQAETNSNTCRKTWYQTDQGSHLVLWEVFNTIEASDSTTLFASRESLTRYRFLFPEQQAFDERYDGRHGERVERDLSQYGLPLGFVKDKSQLNRRNYLGFTCAACHTGEVTYQGRRYYVEGGQANADVADFLLELANTLEANRNDRAKNRRFRSRFRRYVFRNPDLSARPLNAFAGNRYLDDAIRYLNGFNARNRNLVATGPSRLDAIGSILNQLHVSFTGKPDSQAQALTAPVSIPYVWGVSELECVQTNCISNVPIDRNVGEVLGVFGYVNIDEDENVNDLIELAFRGITPLFDHTAKVDNMHALETALSKLSPPKWPASFPALSPSRIQRGREVYAAQCGGCHVDTTDGVSADEKTKPNSIGRQYIKIGRVPYQEVGTDPAFAQDYGTRKAPTGILGAVLNAVAPDSVDPETGLTFGEKIPEELNALVLLGVTANVITDEHFNSLGFKIRAERADRSLPAKQAVEKLVVEYKNGHIDRNLLTPTAYRAKPLDGIAFTAPYLHNGSVRTLWELLQAPEQRATVFRVGSTEFDPSGVGYQDAGDFSFDTRKRGNSNAGHRYGTDLSRDDKLALLEYLKAL